MLRMAIELCIAWLIIAICVCMILRGDQIDRNDQVRYCLAMTFVVSLLMAFRTLGLDIVGYERLYPNEFCGYWASHDFWSGLSQLSRQQYEPIHYLIAFFTGPNGFPIYLAIMAFFPQAVVCFISSTRKNPIYYYCSFLLMYLFQFDVTRQFFATGFYLLSLLPKSVLISVFVSFGIGLAHYGTLATPLAVALKKKRMSQVGILALGLFAIIAVYFITHSNILGMLAPDSAYFQVRSSAYEIGSVWSDSLLKTIEIFFYPVSSLLFFLFFYRKDENINEDRMLGIAWNLNILSYVFFFALLLGAQNDVLAYRYHVMISACSFLLLGDYFDRNQDKEYKVTGIAYLVLIDVVHTLYYLSMYLG